VNLDYAFLADASRVENGKLYVLGGAFTIMWRDSYPALPLASVAMGFTYASGETGRSRRVRLHLADADGAELIPDLELELQLPPRDPNMPARAALHIPLTFDLPQAPILPTAGSYALEIMLDDNHVGSVPFVVAEPPVAQAA
jgi:Family of unknown function (DUF6941)